MKFPLIGGYTSNHGSGEPILLPSHDGVGAINDTVVNSIARFNLITLDATPFDSRPDVLARIRELNPNIKIFCYALHTHDFFAPFPNSFWGERSDITYNLLPDDLGHLHSTDGQIYPNLITVNYGNVDIARALSDLWIRRIASSGLWDGIFLDCSSTDVGWASSTSPGNKLMDYQRAGFQSLHENDMCRRANWEWFCDAQKKAGIKDIIANGVVPTGLKMKHLSGTMFEGWPTLQGGTLEAAFQLVATTPLKYNIIKNEAGAGWTVGSKEWNQYGRFGLASACMTNSYYNYYAEQPFAGQPNNTFMNWWMDEYSVTPLNPGHTDGRSDPTGRYVGWLGEAVGPAYKDITGCYIRKFPYGLVILNGTGMDQNVDLGAPLWRRIYGTLDPKVNNGKTEKVVHVPNYDAVFMLALRHP